MGGTTGWMAFHDLESRVPKVAVFIVTVAESERVAPEEPLKFEPHKWAAGWEAGKNTHCEGRNQNPNHSNQKVSVRKNVLSLYKTRVEESHSGDHQPHDNGACEGPSDVAVVVHDCHTGVRVSAAELTHCER